MNNNTLLLEELVPRSMLAQTLTTRPTNVLVLGTTDTFRNYIRISQESQRNILMFCGWEDSGR